MVKKVIYDIASRDRTGKATTSAKKNFASLDRAVGGLKAKLIGIAGAAGFGAMVKSALNAGDRIQKLSIRIGASTEALSEYEHVAKLTGVSMTQLSTAWQRQTRRIAEANQGTGEAVKALDELGLSAERLNQLAPEDQFEVIADALSQVENQSDRVRLAMKFWDSEGVSLLQTVQGGSKALRQMRGEARELGLTLTKEAADSMAEANDAMERIKASSQGLVRSLVVDLAPGITLTSDILRAVVPSLLAWAKGLGAVATAAVSLFSGQFSEARDAVKLWWQDTQQVMDTSADRISQAWKRMEQGGQSASRNLRQSIATQADLARETARQTGTLADWASAQQIAADATDEITEASVEASVGVRVLTGSLNDATAAARQTTRVLEETGSRIRQLTENISVVDIQLPRGFIGGPLRSFGNFAPGGEVPVNGLYRLEQGEQVVSNTTTNNFGGITLNGNLPNDPSEARSWVRDVLMPAIDAETNR